MDLSGKNVVFVAGLGGIGFESCKILMTKNLAFLVILDVIENPNAIETLKAINHRTKIIYEKFDITDKAGIKNTFNKIINSIKYIDVLINGAGVILDRNIELAVNINLIGLINTTMEALPYMDKTQKGRGGVLMNIASVVGLEPSPAVAVYSATKFGVVGFTRSLADHPKGYTGVVAHKNKLFKREIMAYKEIIPRVEELLASIGDTTKIAPACYYTTETPEPFLILEDMNLNGFENFEKGRLLNLDYVLPTIDKLAKLHACSAVVAAENSKIMETFEEAPISRNPDRKDFLGFFPVNIRCVAEEISHWKGYEEITEKMFKLAENVLQSAVDMYESHEHGFRVFNMADLWVDNLMFHVNNETKEPDDVVLLDFQLSYYGSPAMDLNYLLFGSLNENVRKVHMKYIVREYHRILKETLEKLNYEGEIPTLKEISIEIIKNSLQGVIAATCLTPIIFMEKDGFENLENLTSRTEEGDEMRRKNVENPKYRAFLQRTVKEFELSGFLDV